MIDIGCGYGFWLNIFDDINPSTCSFTGIDIDESAIKHFKNRTANWKRPINYLCIDIQKDIQKIPKADMFLVFNVFPYIKKPEYFLNALKKKLNEGGKIVIRQYDGSTLRFGPMDNSERTLIDTSLFSSLSHSEEFGHYALDKIFSLVNSTSEFESKNIYFELFQRVYPYQDSFEEYFRNTIEWTLRYVSEKAKKRLKYWYKNHFPQKTYLL